MAHRDPPSSSNGVEYRLRWRRQERGRTYRIYQTREAAHRKARGILALEAVKHETSMSDMPDLAEPPVIEEREVGAWTRSHTQASPPVESDLAGMRTYFGRDDEGYGPF